MFWNEANGLAKGLYEQGIPMKEWNLYHRIRQNPESTWYRFPAAAIPDTILRYEVMGNWRGYFQLLRAHRMKSKDEDAEKQSTPSFQSWRYMRGMRPVPFRDRMCTIRDGELIIGSKSLNLRYETRLPDGTDVRLARIVPRLSGLDLMITYVCESPPADVIPKRVVGIDLGMARLMTIATNFGVPPVAIHADPVYDVLNKIDARIGHLQSIYAKQGIKHSKWHPVKRMARLYDYRSRVVRHIVHTVSKAVVDWCIDNRAGRIVVGHNRGWKQHTRSRRGMMESKKNRSKFAKIPHSRIVNAMRDKAARAGIEFVEVRESHTSKVSFFDCEEICHHSSYLGRRDNELFYRPDGSIVHADVNGAYNIIKRQYPELIDPDTILSYHGVSGDMMFPIDAEWDNIASIYIPRYICDTGE